MTETANGLGLLTVRWPLANALKNGSYVGKRWARIAREAALVARHSVAILVEGSTGPRSAARTRNYGMLLAERSSCAP